MKRWKSAQLKGQVFHPISGVCPPTGFLQVIGTWSVNCTILLHVSHEQFLMEGDAVAPFLFCLAFFISLSLSSEGLTLCLGIVHWQVFSAPLFFSFLFFLPSLCHSPHYSLSLFLYFCCLSSSVSHFHQYSSTPPFPPSLSALNLPLPFSPIISYCLYLIFCHSLSLSFSSIFPFPLSNCDSQILIFTTWLPYLLSSPLLSSPLLSTLFLRPHSHVDLFGGGPRRDWRGGGCYRLHPALPSHRPRQIPHQTQRSTAHTHRHMNTRGRTYACMHECVHRDTLA